MKKHPAAGPTVKGLDVSHWDAKVDFTKVKAAGYEFCWSKCTEGVSYFDDRYVANKKNAKAAGVIFGAYHFFRPGIDAAKQAAWFLKNADIQAGDFRPMFDWEVFQGRDVDKARVFLNIVEKATGQKMVIYGPPYALNDQSLPAEFKEYPLCIAHYGTMEPLVPYPWSYWSFHQFTDRGDVPGIPESNEDLDRFNGTLENLKKFCL